MSNDYEYGKEFEFDELRARQNITKIIQGKLKRKGKVNKIKKR